LHFVNLHGFWTEFFEILLQVSVEQVIRLVRVSIRVNHLFHFGSFLISLSYEARPLRLVVAMMMLHVVAISPGDYESP
jgi:hypothetical protein